MVVQYRSGGGALGHSPSIGRIKVFTYLYFIYIYYICSALQALAYKNLATPLW